MKFGVNKSNILFLYVFTENVKKKCSKVDQILSDIETLLQRGHILRTRWPRCGYSMVLVVPLFSGW
jgi:hypothetical protein